MLSSTVPPRHAKASRKICFYDKVKVCYFASVNTVLRNDLFYKQEDYYRFKSEFIKDEIRRLTKRQLEVNTNLKNGQAQLRQTLHLCERNDAMRPFQKCSMHEKSQLRQQQGYTEENTQLIRTQSPPQLATSKYCVHSCKRPAKAVAA